MARAGTLYLCRTATGEARHLCRFPAGVTLCGHLVDHLERNWRTGAAVPFGDHWRSGSVSTTTGDICAHCEART